jgi:hypothetical protein
MIEKSCNLYKKSWALIEKASKETISNLRNLENKLADTAKVTINIKK